MIWWSMGVVLATIASPLGVLLISMLAGFGTRRAWSGVLIGAVAALVPAINIPDTTLVDWLPSFAAVGLIGSMLGWFARAHWDRYHARKRGMLNVSEPAR